MENRDARWSVSEAKARFSEVLDRARVQPQIIENRGKEMAIILDMSAYRRLQAHEAVAAQNTRIAEFLRTCKEIQEEGGAELELPPREVRSSPFQEEDAL
ncbi:MAG: type II toxin-antitoxin system Phd/YefM family antitoxin [Candidatus Schekmanbacteria bacterium]|nr:type II toxin-antitoxin system Phd/YefM family antitoxin [Candidatus Schekmanbacteria bacterium]